MGLEIRQDLLATAAGQQDWSDRDQPGVRWMRTRRGAAVPLVQPELGRRPTHRPGQIAVRHPNGEGVCRDFAHLAIAFCRCMNSPARYCTGYLSDIEVPPPHSAMDFAAWFEACLGDGWHVFDPRNNTPRIGRILIARGRDAADVALTTTVGPSRLESFQVRTA
jgi:transglutaminase-like putative cysteine protease